MPLHILIVLVVFGIAGIALLLHLTGRSTPRRITGPDEATRLWAESYPTLPAKRALVNGCGEAALVHHSDGIGVVWVMGQDVVARILSPGEVRTANTGDGVTLHLSDFSAPHVAVALSSEEHRVWRTMLSEIAP